MVKGVANHGNSVLGNTTKIQRETAKSKQKKNELY